MPNDILTLEKIHHVFPDGKLEAIKEVSFSVRAGSFTALIGPSGCGKSTLLRIIAGLIKPTKGKIKVETDKISMVFQNFALFPWLTVEENIEFGLKMRGMSEEHRRKIVQEKIVEVGLNGFEKQYPQSLSGGMRQRVGIARALTMEPELLLMDEPFSSLDTFTAEKLRSDLLGLWLKYKMTVIMVTHLIEEAVQMADEIVVFSRRPSHVKEVKKIEMIRPRNLRSREFFKIHDELSAKIDRD